MIIALTSTAPTMYNLEIFMKHLHQKYHNIESWEGYNVNNTQRFSIAPTVSKRFNSGKNFSRRCSRKTFFYWGECRGIPDTDDTSDFIPGDSGERSFAVMHCGSTGLSSSKYGQLLIMSSLLTPLRSLFLAWVNCPLRYLILLITCVFVHGKLCSEFNRSAICW